ncbi:hypothetical protein C922_03218 [Plasmodium inui San Antonio 1]|uniref:E3 ubiquitin protein ligase n=1 Tax=Plasmodium inui San Antonio 1 TaxID=1237626 RepID=W6ZZG5_9APIC|nr:hypothetical protein C922_03218 [Plasmodium inui San Antonio 1]EUD66302.1 hypothetical protein C922_03218 [Plasmodium inui San Antonio 1]
MNSKKRSRSGKSECMTLPLEKTELLIENIHNLRNAIALYRKELQEKNKYISDVKADLTFYECLLRNVNVVWHVFNDDLLRLAGGGVEEEATGDGRCDGGGVGALGGVCGVGDVCGDCQDKGDSRCDGGGHPQQPTWQCEKAAPPYYDVEQFKRIFLKYVSKHKKENEEEEEDSDFFNSPSEDDACGEENSQMEEGELPNGSSTLKGESFPSDLKRSQEGNEAMYGTEKDRNRRQPNELSSSKGTKGSIMESDTGSGKMEQLGEGAHSGMKDHMKGEDLSNDEDNGKRMYLSSKEEINFDGALKGGVERSAGTQAARQTDRSPPTDVKVKRERGESGEGAAQGAAGEAAKEAAEGTGREDLAADLRNGSPLDRKLQTVFLTNMKKTITVLNRVLDSPKRVIPNYSKEYVRKLHYEKKLYYEKFISEKKKRDEMESKCDELRIELDRLEKKKTALLFKLNNESICNSILEEENTMESLAKETLSGGCTKGEDTGQRNQIGIAWEKCGFLSYSTGRAGKTAVKGEGGEDVVRGDSTILGSGKKDAADRGCLSGEHPATPCFLHFDKVITKEKILHSEPFRKLIKESTEVYKELKEREGEIVVLKNELLKREQMRDEEYENLLNDTMNDKKCLSGKIKNLEVDLMTCSMEREKMQRKVNMLEHEIKTLKGIEANHVMQLEQKEKDICRMRVSIDKLKVSESTLRERIISLETEAAVGETMLNGTCDELVAVPGGDLHSELIAENKQLRRALEKKENAEKELSILRKNYDAMSEEIEEITKEFEKKQEQVDEMIIQIKNKEFESLEKYKNIMNKTYVEENIKQLERTYEEKISSINRLYEKYENFANLYLSLFYYARRSAVISDSAHEEQMSLFVKMKDKCESIFQRKNELEEILRTVYGSNRKLIDKCIALYRENQHLEQVATSSKGRKNPKDASSKGEGKEKEEEEGKEAKEVKHEVEEELEDKQLLIEENNELRRRLMCSVCMENFKNHIIVKCGHIYCESCIFSNLKTRNRKCPQCKIPFDKKDLQKIFLD